MSEFEIRETEHGEDLTEAWTRVIDHVHTRELRGVDACKLADHGLRETWHVAVDLMEFLRDDPLEQEVRARVRSALGAVSGVSAVWEADRQLWAIQGDPSGRELVAAVATVLDAVAGRSRAWLLSDCYRNGVGFTWKGLLAPWTSELRPYRAAATFEEGDLVNHTRFGVGVVTAVVSPSKIQVLFEDEARTLAQGLSS